MLAGIFTPATSQIVYENFFDTQSEQDTRTLYRLGDADSHDWEFVTGNPYSAPYCVYHDYPMDNGVTYVEDWLVSEPLSITANGLFSLYVAQSRFSTPPDVYLGVWFSDGSPDPADGDFVEVVDLTNFPVAQNAYEDTIFQMPYGGNPSYIAFKYAAGQGDWLIVWLDDLALIGAYPVGIGEEPAEMNVLNVFPNPFNDNCNFIINDEIFIKYADDLRVEIYDNLGRKNKEIISPVSQFILERNNMTKGLYYYLLKTESKVLSQGKLIIN